MKCWRPNGIPTIVRHRMAPIVTWNILVNDGTAFEIDIHLHFATIFQKLDGMIGLELEIMIIGLGSEADFLDHHFRRLRLNLFLFLLLIVKKLLVIHHAAYRRSGLRRNLH